jgi:hypothetical protein
MVWQPDSHSGSRVVHCQNMRFVFGKLSVHTVSPWKCHLRSHFCTLHCRTTLPWNQIQDLGLYDCSGPWSSAGGVWVCCSNHAPQRSLQQQRLSHVPGRPYNCSGTSFCIGKLLILGPMLIANTFYQIYLCLSRIVVVYGETLSRFRPRTYTIVFCTCDFICLILQALGGAIASTANTESSSNLGKNLMLAGLIFQDVSLALFAIACTDFFLRVRKSRGNWNARYLDIANSRLFKVFLFGLMTATITIFIRSSYRIVELSGGFDSNLFKSDEAVFMIFEGFMIVIATSCLTLLHPAVCFQGAFASANFSFRVKKNVNDSSMNSDQESQHSGVPLSMMGHSSREYVALSK